MEQICYRKGDYKYTLLHDWEWSTGVTFERDVEVEGGWVRLLRDGTMYIRKDYHWDGPSGPEYQQPQYRLNYDRLGNYRSLVMQKYQLH